MMFVVFGKSWFVVDVDGDPPVWIYHLRPTYLWWTDAPASPLSPPRRIRLGNLDLDLDRRQTQCVVCVRKIW